MSLPQISALTPSTSSGYAKLAPGWLHPLLAQLPQKLRAFAVGASVEGRPVGLLLGRRHRLGKIGQIVHLALRPEAIGCLIEMLGCAERALRTHGFDAASLTLYQLHPSQVAKSIQAAGWHLDTGMTTWVRRELRGVLPPVVRAADRSLGEYTEIKPWGELDRPVITALDQEHAAQRALGKRVWEPGLGPTKRADPQLSFAVVRQRRLLGWIMLTRRRRGLLYDRLFVRPDAQGRGLGAALIAKAIMAHLHAEPCTPAFAHVPDSRISAARMYKRHLAPYADEESRALVFLKTLTG